MNSQFQTLISHRTFDREVMGILAWLCY